MLYRLVQSEHGVSPVLPAGLSFDAHLRETFKCFEDRQIVRESSRNLPQNPVELTVSRP